MKQHTHDLIQQFMDTVQTIDQITECYNIFVIVLRN